MMESLGGVAFSPTNQDDRMRNGASGAPGQEGGSVNPIQEAIRTLSYRVPRQTGGQGLAPAALLAGPGSAGVPGGSPMSPMGGGNPVQTGLEQLLRLLFGGGMGPMASPGGGGMPSAAPMAGLMNRGSAPAPNVIPGGSGPQAEPTTPWNPAPPAQDPRASALGGLQMRNPMA